MAIGLPLLFLMVVGAGVGAYFLFFGGGPSTDMLAWAPSSSTNIRGVNYSKISGIPSMKRTASGQLSRIENLGVSLDNIDEALMATGPGGEAVVVRTKSSLDPAVLMKVARATEKTANGKKYYQAPSGYFHVPSGRLLVFCPGETTMTELLRKDAKVTISDELRGYVNKAGGDIWEANVNTGNIGVNGFFPRPKAAYGGVSITGNYIKITRTSIYADANAARTAEKVLQMDIKVMTSGSGKRIDSTDVTVSGTTVTLKVAGFFENDGSDFSGFRGF